MEFKDYYKTLGVTPETPVEEIKRAYRKLARQYHPDVSKVPDAEARFKEVNEAWEVLQDPQKKAHYDQIRTGGWQQQHQQQHPHYEQHADFGETADFSEFFNSIFGGGGFAQDVRGQHHPFRSKGQDIHAKIHIPLTVAYEGGVQSIQLQMGQEVKSLNVKIPPGVTNGSQIRLKEQGRPGMGGGPNGDLYIEVSISHHPFFSIHHKDIHLKLPITPWEAALGATLSVPTLGGNVNLKIPPHSQTGQKMRLKGRGMPSTPPGDQFVILEIHTPKAEDEKAKAFYEEMAKSFSFNPRINLGSV